MDNITVEILSGSAAHRMLSNDEFLKHWYELFEYCEYATVCQHPSFVCTWYRTYREQWIPVIISSYNSSENLSGLWLLAYNQETRNLEHAGSYQAEYQTWLTLPGVDIAFLSKAWTKLKANFDFTELHFKYLPSSGLWETLKSVPNMLNYTVAKKYRRPLRNIEENAVKIIFSKKSRKKLNKLEMMGKVEFRRITCPYEFEKIFDELISFYDFRMGAVNSVIPFQKDKLKRTFYSDLLFADKNSFLVSVTYLNNRPIAGGLSGVCKGTIHLYLGMHSPFLEAYSPGIIHMLQLYEYLPNEAIKVIDFTPGGDAWKERFAASHDEVFHAVLFNSSIRKKRKEFKNIIAEQGKHTLCKLGIKPDKLKSKLFNIVDNLHITAEIIKYKRWKRFERELIMYEYKRNSSATFSEMGDIEVKRNSIEDLLSFKSGNSSFTCCKFLTKAHSLFEKGAVCYTVNSGKCVVAYGWMMHEQDEFTSESGQQPIALPARSAIIFNLYAHDEFSKPEINQILIDQMLKDAFSYSENQNVYVLTESKDLLMKKTIESMNFEYKKTYLKNLAMFGQN